MNRKIVIMVSKSYVYTLVTHMQTKIENMAHADLMLSIRHTFVGRSCIVHKILSMVAVLESANESPFSCV